LLSIVRPVRLYRRALKESAIRAGRLKATIERMVIRIKAGPSTSTAFRHEIEGPTFIKLWLRGAVAGFRTGTLQCREKQETAGKNPAVWIRAAGDS
jgi:hypothetical protein